MIWILLATALAAPGGLVREDGSPLEPLQAEYLSQGTGSRYAVRVDKASLIASPLAWDGSKNSCDDDESAIGDPNRTKQNPEHVPKWCPGKGKEDQNTSIPTLRLNLQGSLDLRPSGEEFFWPSDQLNMSLQRLDGVRRVWAHTHFASGNRKQAPCMAPGADPATVYATMEGKSKLGLSDAARVQVGWLDTGDLHCKVLLEAGTYAFDEGCPIRSGLPDGHLRGALYLFSFARNYAPGQCEHLEQQGPWGAVIRIEGSAPPSPGWAGGTIVPPFEEKPKESAGRTTRDVAGTVEAESLPTWARWLIGAALCALLVLMVTVVALYLLGKGVVAGVARLATFLSAGWDGLRQRLGRGKPEAPPAPNTVQRLEQIETETPVPRSFSQSLGERTLALWEELDPKQRETLKGISDASRFEQYRGALCNYCGDGELGNPFAGSEHASEWQHHVSTLKAPDFEDLGDLQIRVAVCATLATLALEARAFTEGRRSNYNRPSSNGALMTVFVQALGFPPARIHGDWPTGVHPARQLACWVLREVSQTEIQLDAMMAVPATEVETEPKVLRSAPEPERLSEQGNAEAQAELKRLIVQLREQGRKIAELTTRAGKAEDLVRTQEDELSRLLGELATATKRAEAQEKRADVAEAKLSDTHKKWEAGAVKLRELSDSNAAIQSQLTMLLGEQETRRQAEEAARLARESKLKRGDARFLVDSMTQVYAYGALREAARHVAEICEHTDHGSLGAGSRSLLETSANLRLKARESSLAGETAYLEVWLALEDELKKGRKLLLAFVAGARQIEDETDATRLVERLLDEVEAFYPKGAGQDPETWAEGFAAWRTFFRPAERSQTDDGAALGTSLKRQVFELALVPWLRLSQFLSEALPVEVRGKIGNQAEALDLDTPRIARAAFGRLGYSYEHVALYKASKRDYITRRNQVAVSPVRGAEVWFGLPHPEAEAQTVVRVQQPLIVQGPTGHLVRAQIWCLEEET